MIVIKKKRNHEANGAVGQPGVKPSNSTMTITCLQCGSTLSFKEDVPHTVMNLYGARRKFVYITICPVCGFDRIAYF